MGRLSPQSTAAQFLDEGRGAKATEQVRILLELLKLHPIIEPLRCGLPAPLNPGLGVDDLQGSGKLHVYLSGTIMLKSDIDFFLFVLKTFG